MPNTIKIKYRMAIGAKGGAKDNRRNNVFMRLHFCKEVKSERQNFILPQANVRDLISFLQVRVYFRYR